MQRLEAVRAPVPANSKMPRMRKRSPKPPPAEPRDDFEEEADRLAVGNLEERFNVGQDEEEWD